MSVKLNITEVSFLYNVNNKIQHDYDYDIPIYSGSGIEIFTDGKKNIEKTFLFKSSQIISKRVVDALRLFQSKVINEGYRGSFNMPKRSHKPQSVKPKTINNKYTQ